MFKLQLHVRFGAHAAAMHHFLTDERIQLIFAAGSTYLSAQTHWNADFCLQCRPYIDASTKF